MAKTTGYWLTTKRTAPATAFSTTGFPAARVTRSSGGRTYYNYRLNADTTAFSWQNWNTTQPSSSSITLPLTPGVVQSVYSFSSGTAVSGGTVSGYVLDVDRYSFSISAGTGGTASAAYDGGTGTVSYGYIVKGTSNGTSYDGVSTWCVPIKLTATASTNYTFDGWYLNGSKVSSSATYTVTSYTGDTTYSAVFTATGANVTAVSESSTKGSVTGGGNYSYGSTVTLVATPNTGYTFAAWKKNGSTVSTSATYQFTMSSSAAGTYTATFTAQQYTITASVSPSGAGTVTGGGTYSYGDSVTLTISQTSSQQILNPFSHWTKNGSTYSSSTSITFTASSSDTYVAVCTDVVYGNYTFASGNPALGTVSTAGGQYIPNTTVSCTASVGTDVSAVFVNWTNSGGTVVSTSATYSFTAVSGAAESFVANFARSNATITVSAGTGGTATGTTTAAIGSIVTISATPSTGYTFLRWSDGNASATRQVCITGNETYTATFAASGSSPIPPAPANPDDLYIVRDMRNDGSRVYPHVCDIDFLAKAVQDRVAICGGTASAALAAAPANRSWHAAADMLACADGIKTWVQWACTNAARVCYAKPANTGFPATLTTTWGSSAPSFAGDVPTNLAKLCDTTGFFVERAGVAYDSINGLDSAAVAAVAGGPIPEDHVRGLYYDLCDRGTNLVFNASISTPPVLSWSNVTLNNYIRAKNWGTIHTPSDSTTSSTYSGSPWVFTHYINTAHSTRSDGREEWGFAECWQSYSSTTVSLLQAAQGVVDSLVFITALVVDVQIGSTRSFRLVPYVWRPSSISAFSPPWLSDMKSFAAGIYAGLGICGDGDSLAMWAASQGYSTYWVGLMSYGTIGFAHLNLDTNVESYGWTPVFPTPS